MDWKLRLDPKKDAPLYRQIADAIRAAVDSGKLVDGERIPSMAELARKLGINKLTVAKAFQELGKGGLLRSRVGHGSFIAVRGAGGAALPANEPLPELGRPLRRLREGYARGLREMLLVERPAGTINLSGGVPNPDAIPERLLEHLCGAVLAHNPRRLYEYASPAGLPELREAVAARLAKRGIALGPDELIITNGSQQALSLAALAAREEGRTALCETPTYAAVPQLFMLYSNTVKSITRELGASALNREQLLTASGGRRTILYVCPDFHNPTGETMATQDRLELAQWATGNDVLVVADEIFRDLRFEGNEPPSLYTMLPTGRRILVSSLSKTFMTGLRGGFLAADRSLINELLPFKRYLDLGSPSLTQAICAAFLTDGYETHLQKVRASYRARRDVALAALERYMPPGVAWTRPEGGFQLWLTMPPALSSIQLFVQAMEQGVAIVPGPAHDIDGGFLNCFRLGYGHCSSEDLRRGIARLAQIIQSLAARSAAALPGGADIIV